MTDYYSPDIRDTPQGNFVRRLGVVYEQVRSFLRRVLDDTFTEILDGHFPQEKLKRRIEEIKTQHKNEVELLKLLDLSFFYEEPLLRNTDIERLLWTNKEEKYEKISKIIKDLAKDAKPSEIKEDSGTLTCAISGETTNYRRIYVVDVNGYYEAPLPKVAKFKMEVILFEGDVRPYEIYAYIIPNKKAKEALRDVIERYEKEAKEISEKLRDKNLTIKEYEELQEKLEELEHAVKWFKELLWREKWFKYRLDSWDHEVAVPLYLAISRTYLERKEKEKELKEFLLKVMIKRLKIPEEVANYLTLDSVTFKAYKTFLEEVV